MWLAELFKRTDFSCLTTYLRRNVKEVVVGALMDYGRTIDEAIKRAKNTRQGLAAGIVTKNLDIANTVSRSIRAGIFWINCYFAFDQDCPYGGYKASGFERDLGLNFQNHKYNTSCLTSLFKWISWYDMCFCTH